MSEAALSTRPSAAVAVGVVLCISAARLTIAVESITRIRAEPSLVIARNMDEFFMLNNSVRLVPIYTL